MGRRPKYTQVQKIKNDLTDAFNRANGIEAAEIFGMLFEVLNEQKAKITPSVVVAEPGDPVFIVALDQHHPGRRAQAAVHRGERHRIRLGDFRAHRFGEPLGKLPERVGV